MAASPRPATRSSVCERQWPASGTRSWRHSPTTARRSSMFGRASPSARSSACTRQLERTLKLGAGIAVPPLLFDIAFADLAAGPAEQARDRLEGLFRSSRGRFSSMMSYARGLLAEARWLLADGAAEATAAQTLRPRSVAGHRVGRRVAVVNRPRVPVRMVEERLPADARVEHVSVTPGVRYRDRACAQFVHLDDRRRAAATTTRDLAADEREPLNGRLRLAGRSRGPRVCLARRSTAAARRGRRALGGRAPRGRTAAAGGGSSPRDDTRVRRPGA